ncbi:unnamed protein product, partial [Sphagnum compactum]
KVVNDSERDNIEMELFFKEHSVDAKTPRGHLSPAAINTIEQFSRLNGLTGRKMRANFEANAPVAVQNEARCLVEFCVFRYLARRGADFHPSLQDASFRRWCFIAMLAWQRPYVDDVIGNEKQNPRRGTVGKDAFVRIAPSIAGAADRPTAPFLFDALVGDKSEGLTFETWDQYLRDLCGVLEDRHQYQESGGVTLGLQPGECIVSVGDRKRQPVQKWNGNLVWPGRLTLTDRALYFEGNGIASHQAPIKMDISTKDAFLEKKRVGPFGAELFDSAISVSSSPQSEAWVLEFVDFAGEQRRDMWYAMVNELICLYRFVDMYGPKDGDPLLGYIYGAKNGRNTAISSAIQGIARLQAVQYTLGKPPTNFNRLLQFSFLIDAPSGELVCQTLAVDYWGGRMDSKAKEIDFSVVGGSDNGTPEDSVAGIGHDAIGIDGSVFLQRWMTAPSWKSTKSINFWRQTKGGMRGLVLGKFHVVGGLTHVQRAVTACWEQGRVADKTKATIDGAMLKGIPNNIDLLKELLLPFSILSINFQKLKKWEDPALSAAFLLGAAGLIYKNWLRYVLPAILLSCAGILFSFRGLKAQGRLGGDFGKVTIRDQPPTNTIQKIMALKEALMALENFLQTANIALLKLRTVALARHLASTNEVLMALIVAGITTWVVPYRFLVGAFLIDQFTVELPFRRKGVEELVARLKDWWITIPAAPVAVLPPNKEENRADTHLPEESMSGPNQGEAVMQALSEWLSDEE